MSLMQTVRVFPVTTETFWKQVGLELERIRLRQDYPSTYALYTRHRDKAPAYNTLNDIEAGRPGYVDSINSYAAVLGVKLVDVFRHILGDGPAELDADAVRVALAFQNCANPTLRAGLLAMAEVLERAGTSAPVPQPPPAAPIAPPAASPRSTSSAGTAGPGSRGTAPGRKKRA